MRCGVRPVEAEDIITYRTNRERDERSVSLKVLRWTQIICVWGVFTFAFDHASRLVTGMARPSPGISAQPGLFGPGSVGSRAMGMEQMQHIGVQNQAPSQNQARNAFEDWVKQYAGPPQQGRINTDGLKQNLR
jgi:hypothetical protein